MILDNSRYVAWWSSPERYRLKYQLNVAAPGPPPYPLARGLALHAMAELEDNPVELEKRLIELGDDKATRAAKGLYKAYTNYNATGAPAVVAVEREFKMQIPGSPHFVAGRLDQILQYSNGDYWVGDLKTAKANKSRADVDWQWKHDSQAGFVILGARHLGWDVKGLLVRTIVEGTPPRIWPIVVERSQYQLETLLRNVHQTCETIKLYLDTFGVDDPWPHRESYPCYKEGMCEYETVCRRRLTEEDKSKFCPRKEHLNIIQTPSKA